jgi:hypothetical protein
MVDAKQNLRGERLDGAYLYPPVLLLSDHRHGPHRTDATLRASTYVHKTVHVTNPSHLHTPMERRSTPNQSVFSYVPGTTDQQLTEDS